jgi:hypothetical protein
MYFFVSRTLYIVYSLVNIYSAGVETRDLRTGSRDSDGWELNLVSTKISSYSEAFPVKHRVA